ncbi:MAG: 30S ribosomal protein S1 [Alphaproteobacteria bacterium]|nr:30S ribosomal protein S1 [Alphaproteobacteria bacterium]MBO7641812.1 30S ribosomal protein S1 [Alphaproteobacteria bacterium]
MSEELVTQEKSFAELFEESCEKSLWENKVVKGKIVAVDSNFVTIDVGLKSEGRVALTEFNYNGNVELKAGDEIDVFIDRYEDKSGSIVLSREKALREAAWDDLEKSFKEGANVMGTMFNRVKGGFMVNLGGVTAFLPGSQVDVRPVKDISPLMGVEQPFLILKMDKQRENIVVSRKGVLEGANAEERAKVIEKLEEGQILDGIVKNITSYGAFVDIGGVDGLLHNTDISWKRINHPSEVLTPGQEVKVKVIKFNKETKRISLGMKQLVADPWEGVDVEFTVGAKVKGKVTNVTDYGIFVEVKEGVEGLVYVSEISWKKNVSPSKVATAGEEIDVIVLDVDVAKRRMGLGIKQLQDNPWTKLAEEFPVGKVFDSIISNIAEFGLFVKVADDIDGMVHINDISWERVKDEDFAKFKKGDAVKVKVLEVDVEKERISLGMKQLTENPYGDSDVDVRKGVVVTCVVTEVKEDGLEVTLPNGVHGFIKKADLAKDRQDRKTDRFAVGEKVDAKITSVDRTGRKVGLSIKALEIEEEKQVMAEFGSSDSGASLGDILGLAINKKTEE